jgi:hypothetical protein
MKRRGPTRTAVTEDRPGELCCETPGCGHRERTQNQVRRQCALCSMALLLSELRFVPDDGGAVDTDGKEWTR